MARMRFEHDPKGIGTLLKSAEVKDMIASHAEGMKQRAGDGYNIRYGRTRVVAFVETGSDEAAQDNLDNNTLLKAVRK